MIKINLICWHCGEGRTFIAPHEPQFGFELAGFAQEAGMVGYADMNRGRVLIFCNEAHAKNEMTKSGAFRARPKGPSEESA